MRSVKAGLTHALPGQVMLFPRNGDARHAAAGPADRLQGETAPAAADLEDVVVRTDPGHVHDGGHLVALRLFQAVIRRAAGRAPRSRTCSGPGKGGRTRCPDRNARRCSAGCPPRCWAVAGAPRKLSSPPRQGRQETPVVQDVLAQGQQLQKRREIRGAPSLRRHRPPRNRCRRRAWFCGKTSADGPSSRLAGRRRTDRRPCASRRAAS